MIAVRCQGGQHPKESTQILSLWQTFPIILLADRVYLATIRLACSRLSALYTLSLQSCHC